MNTELGPMIRAVEQELQAAGVAERRTLGIGGAVTAAVTDALPLASIASGAVPVAAA
jgi:hypothetical protein